MTFEELKEIDQQYVMQTYGRSQVIMDHGVGATVYDTEGKKYIDFTSGIGVNNIGYGNPVWIKAVTEQASKLAHISNLFYSEPYVKLAQKLCERSGMSNCFFGNSGAEANEGMIKLARKYSFDKYDEGRGTIITLKKSFHGRTATTLMATGQDVFHKYFFPLSEGFRYAEANLEDIEANAGHDVCAIMLELVQGEGGVNPMDPAFVQNLRKLCDDRDWLLLVDEVQTGIGRTGTMFAFQQYGIVPDVISFAKGVAGGLPMGGFLANEKCRNVLTAGTHGSTFGGNPVTAAGGLAVQEIISDELLSQVAEKAEYLRAGLDNLNVPCLGKSRGLGLMIGVEVKEGFVNKELIPKLVQNGLLCLTAGKDLRLLPPLVITKEEIDEGLAIMKKALS